MTKSIGRPMKYRAFLEILDDATIYTPTTILRLGESRGLLEPSNDPEELKKQRIRVRHALARYSSNHFFPNRGDGFVCMKGQAPIRGWTGERWKRDLD